MIIVVNFMPLFYRIESLFQVFLKNGVDCKGRGYIAIQFFELNNRFGLASFNDMIDDEPASICPLNHSFAGSLYLENKFP